MWEIPAFKKGRILPFKTAQHGLITPGKGNYLVRGHLKGVHPQQPLPRASSHMTALLRPMLKIGRSEGSFPREGRGVGIPDTLA